MKLSSDQAVPALIAALVGTGVAPEAIETAVSRVLDLQIGASVSGGDPLVRAFATEQTARLVILGTGTTLSDVVRNLNKLVREMPRV